VLFTKRFCTGIGDGTITVAFRRWKRPTVKRGGTLRTAGGMLAIDDVRTAALDAITERDARAAGYDSRAELVTELERREGTLYRIDFHPAGPDPRDALRAVTRCRSRNGRSSNAASRVSMPRVRVGRGRVRSSS
jgi:hypothetical protein